jgi:glycolate oxidase FAD binding subunit
VIPLLPTTEAEAAALVAGAAAARRPLALEGSGTKAAVGRPAQTEATLSARTLTGITLYEPAELVIGARAGTPLAEVERILAEKGQQLTFEPMDFRPLLGSSGEPTIGAVAAANVSGPRRINAGAARDSLIGTRFVNGRGEVIKSGGRVMKNVTGLDLVKLVAGSWGTLGFLTEVVFKVLPIAEHGATLAFAGLDDVRAVTLLSEALGSPFEAIGAAHLPAAVSPDGNARTLIRIEGFETSVRYRLGELKRLLRRYGEPEVLEGDAAAALWRAVRDVGPLTEPRDTAVWRISTAPTEGPAFTARLARHLDARWYYDWGGGLVWLACPATGDAGAAAIRAALATSGGHATLVRAPAKIRAAIDVFEPMAEPVRRLTAEIKRSFDPAGIFNPGRMHAGI